MVEKYRENFRAVSYKQKVVQQGFSVYGLRKTIIEWKSCSIIILALGKVKNEYAPLRHKS